MKRIATHMFLVFLHTIPISICQAFVVNSKCSNSLERGTSLHMINSFVQGLTGKAPEEIISPALQADLLANSNIDPARGNVDLQCVYKASRDGFSAVDFHNNCDGRGSGLVVLLTKSGKVFGGYNPIGWDSTDDYGNTNSAFLWYKKGADKAVKINVLSGGNAAIFDFATGGPQFGSSDLIVGPPKAAVMGGFAGPDMEDFSINAGSLRTATSTFGGAYETDNGWPRGSHNIVEVEVYANENIKPRSKSGGGFNLWPF